MPLKSLKCHSSRRQKFAAKCHSPQCCCRPLHMMGFPQPNVLLGGTGRALTSQGLLRWTPLLLVLVGSRHDRSQLCAAHSHVSARMTANSNAHTHTQTFTRHTHTHLGHCIGRVGAVACGPVVSRSATIAAMHDSLCTGCGCRSTLHPPLPRPAAGVDPWWGLHHHCASLRLRNLRKVTGFSALATEMHKGACFCTSSGG